jgi:hypothetical protein
MALTHSVEDAVEMARLRLGTDGNPWFVSAAGSNAGVGSRPSTAFATLSKAMSVAQPKDKVFFDGQIDQSQTNILVYDLGLDVRQVIIPSGVSLFGANRTTARIKSDPLAGNSVTVVGGGSDVWMENFWIQLIDAGMGFFSHPIGYNGLGSTNVIARNIRVTADSDGAYHRSDTGQGTCYWKYVGCSFETKYDAHTILGTNTDQQIDYEDCDLIVKGPSSVTPTTIGRAVTAQQGLTRLRMCRLITEALGAPTTIVSCCYARAGSGTVSRIEVDDCTVRTRVPAGFVAGGGSLHHLQADAGCEIIATNTMHDKSLDLATGSIIYIDNDALGAGDRFVNHNYGVTDAYRVMHSGSPVDGANLYAYDASSYGSATRLLPNAQSLTGADGRWLKPMHLNAGAYKLVVSKPNQFVDKVSDLTVV